MAGGELYSSQRSKADPSVVFKQQEEGNLGNIWIDSLVVWSKAMHHNSTKTAGPAFRMPAMPLGIGSRCCLQHRALHRQQRSRALPMTNASSDARAEFGETSRQPWFVGMLLLLPMVKIGEAATEVSPGRVCACVIAVMPMNV